VTTIDPMRDHFVLLASDGLFDRFSSQDCVNIVKERLLQMPLMEQDPQKVARELVNEAIYKRLITDNITVILATLNRGIDNTSCLP
jgi:serine/threonine protein phosphatase PrpC